GMNVAFSGREYRGASDGRAFGWGGTTSRWGGLAVPYSELDLAKDAGPESDAWNHIVQVVRERTSRVADTLGLGPKPDFHSFADRHFEQTAAMIRSAGLTAVSAAFVPFSRRNLTYLTRRQVPGMIRVYLNAVASDWNCGAQGESAGEVRHVEAISPAQTRLRVSAYSFVIAAGAIESARILLELDRLTNGQMLPPSAHIGSYLSDHLSCSIADVHPSDLDLAARAFGPVFSKGRLRSFRFIDQAGAKSMAPHFSHFIFDIRQPGFAFAKDALSRLQRRELP